MADCDEFIAEKPGSITLAAALKGEPLVQDIHKRLDDLERKLAIAQVWVSGSHFTHFKTTEAKCHKCDKEWKIEYAPAQDPPP